jgi:hypothetical protein
MLHINAYLHCTNGNTKNYFAAPFQLHKPSVKVILGVFVDKDKEVEWKREMIAGVTVTTDYKIIPKKPKPKLPIDLDF